MLEMLTFYFKKVLKFKHLFREQNILILCFDETQFNRLNLTFKNAIIKKI